MMKWFSKINPIDLAEKNRRISELEKEITRYADALSQARNHIQEIKDGCRSASFEFDFSAVKVFSVERNTRDDIPCTIIGYLLPEPMIVTEDNVTTKEVVREWYLYCDDVQHNKLVESFRESRK